MVQAPFEISPETLALARKRVMAAQRGPDRVRALVDFLSDPKPKGLGLKYDWATSSTAERTLKLGRGDCVALASVMIGLGRGLDWPIYFAEARGRQPVTREFAEVTVLSDHMVVIVVANTVQRVIDFLGLVEEGYEIRPIDDLTAYAHLVNNVAGHRVLSGMNESAEEAWAAALDGFLLATRIQPNLGRAWNNLGIAYSRLGRFDEARAAYQRAVELDTAFGSPERNLTIMETRAAGATTLTESKLPD
jgi:tetratricopeptide (TPR) repeat protein